MMKKMSIGHTIMKSLLATFALLLMAAITTDSSATVTAVAAGTFHSCAVVNGRAQCWGGNSNGQLGNNSITQSLVPVQVTGLTSGVTAASRGADSQHGCAVVNGGAQCWGKNFNGQLGNNSTAQSLVPVQVTGLTSGVTAIAAGDGHSCAVVNGGVQCWGLNNEGQLGDNSTTQSLVPVQPVGLTSGVTAVSAGGSHSCAVVSGGVQCWGRNVVGQLGNNSNTQSLVPVEAIPAGRNVTAVSLAGFHSCAVVNGGAQCWGQNFYRQLGNSGSTDSNVPVQVTGLTSSVTAVAAGDAHSCALVNGGVQCWGNNAGCQLGNSSIIAPSNVPVQVTGLTSGVTALAAGNAHNCAIVSGGVQCWGNNQSGQLGNNSTMTSCVPGAIFSGGPLSLLAVQSRKIHGSVGTFNLAIDATIAIGGAISVEPRVTGTGHTIVFQFSGPVTSVGGVNSLDASLMAVGSATFAIPASPGDEVVVTLTGVPDNQRATISVTNINAAAINASASMGFLVGDVNNTRSVNSSDISAVKARSGQSTTAFNFLFDVNASGAIDLSDVSAVKARSGLTLP